MQQNHCQISSDELDKLQYLVAIFNYHADACSSSTGNSGTESITGAEFMTGDYRSDFALLKLSGMDTKYNIFLAGWDNSGLAPSTSTVIHHPLGDFKKITFEDDIVVTAEWQSAQAPCYNGFNNYWKATFGDPPNTFHGVKGGSSGCPLFSTAGKYVIGQLRGGAVTTTCDQGQTAYFGKFSESWFLSNISSYLNPNIGSPLTCEGIDYNSTTAHCNNNVCDGDEDCMTDPSKPINCGGSCPPCTEPAPTPPYCSFCNPNKSFEGKEWDGKNKTYRAEQTITAKKDNESNFTKIMGNSNIKFIAGSFIELDGFLVEEGSTFEAMIEECAVCPWWCFCSEKTHTDTIHVQYDEGQESGKSLILSQYIIIPNPTTGKFTISAKENTPNELFIYNSLGQLIYQSSIINNQSAIDISSHPRGIYFLKVQSGDPAQNGAGKIYTEKLILSAE